MSTNDAVFLVGVFRWFPSMPGYAHVANHYARKASASIEWYNFYSRRDREIEAIFGSFGARAGLTIDSPPGDDLAARTLADQIFLGLRTKWDVIHIEVDGLRIGDLIYDTYLRVGPQPTVDIHDSKLADIIYQAVRITRACLNYFARKKVVGIIPDHFVYIYSGIITRCAFASGVPVYQVFYGQNFFAYSLSCPAGSRSFPTRSPYAFYRRMFARLTPEEKEIAFEKGQLTIQKRLAGHVDGLLTLVGAAYGQPVVQSAYSGETSEPLLEDTGRPRILVLLHDFCDAVHNYRDLLFPDFYEWIDYLLQHASETEFDWYVKPHPNVARAGLLSELNGYVINELKSKYPRIRFLAPTASSQQIIREGVRAMFTVCGTAGHEFAYLGVPVVNAGDNPHIAYEFNIHPRSLEELADCIARADQLESNIRRADIEEFIYMNYFYLEEKLSSDANPMSPEFLASEEFRQQRSRAETLKWLAYRMSSAEQKELACYLDHLPHITEPLSVDVRTGKSHQPQASILNA